MIGPFLLTMDLQDLLSEVWDAIQYTPIAGSFLRFGGLNATVAVAWGTMPTRAIKGESRDQMTAVRSLSTRLQKYDHVFA